MSRLHIGILCLGLMPVIAGAAESSTPSADPDKTSVAVEALKRLKGMDLESNPALKAALVKVLDQLHDKPQFVELVREFRLKDQNGALLQFAVSHPNTSAGVDAVKMLLENDGRELVKRTLEGTNAQSSISLATALGNIGTKEPLPLLEPVLIDSSKPLELRREAVKGMSKIKDGAEVLLRVAKEDKLSPDLKLLAANELSKSRWDDIRNEAASVFPHLQEQNSEPLPPLSDLVKLKGDPRQGEEVFSRDTVGCIKCHQVRGKGTDVGPNLTEIGTKLAKEALFEAILEPSAGISFGFEAYRMELKDGDEVFGLLVSETPDELAIKSQTGILSKYRKSEVVSKTQQKLSIMPAGLQQTMSKQDLVDLVEFLTTLKKAD